LALIATNSDFNLMALLPEGAADRPEPRAVVAGVVPVISRCGE
jgi:hypothetical protein